MPFARGVKVFLLVVDEWQKVVSMKGMVDRGKSLQELEQDDWGEPTYDSYLVTTVHRLRRKPIGEFSVEDLRIVIGQQIGLLFLVPLAVERLEEEPLAAGDFYPGDLLQAVLRAEETFWAKHPNAFQRVRKVVSRVKDVLPTVDEVDRANVRKILFEAPRALTE
jgi:hypothetical protein